MEKTKKQTYGFGCCGKWMVILLLGGGAIYLLLPEFRPQIINALPFSTIAVMPGDASFYASGTWQATWSHNKIE